MKLNKKPTSQSLSKDTKIFRPQTAAGRTVEIWHTQEIKLSQNYQSASASYGVKLVVDDNPEAIRKGIKRAEEIVETPLVDKTGQQREMLNSL